MSGEEKKNTIDESNIEMLVPNFGDLDIDLQKKCLDDIYFKQLVLKHGNPLESGIEDGE